MRNLVVSLLIIAAMVMGAVVGMAPFLKAAMTEPSSDLLEFELSTTVRVDKTIVAMKADGALKVEILAFAAKWDVDRAERFTDVMLAIKSVYVAADISKDRIVLAWANRRPPKAADLYKVTDELQAAEIHKETGNTIDELAKIAMEAGLMVSSEQKEALFGKFLKANREALLASEIDGKYQMQDDGIYIRLIK